MLRLVRQQDLQDVLARLLIRRSDEHHAVDMADHRLGVRNRQHRRGVDDDQVVFCIGKETGASIGEEFVAYRYTYEDYYDESDNEYYDTIEVGTVVVREIVNEHFAKGVISSGEVTKYDILFSK